MCDSIYDEENNFNDDNVDSLSKSCESISKKKSNTISGSKILNSLNQIFNYR